MATNDGGLPVKHVSYFEVEYHELDSYAKEVYGHDPEIVASEEWTNNSSHKYNSVTGTSGWTKWDKKDWQRFLDEGHASYGITQYLLCDLVERGLAPPGDYLVTIFW